MHTMHTSAYSMAHSLTLSLVCPLFLHFHCAALQGSNRQLLADSSVLDAFPLLTLLQPSLGPRAEEGVRLLHFCLTSDILWGEHGTSTK